MWHEAQENGVVWGALRWRQLQEQKGPGVKRARESKAEGQVENRGLQTQERQWESEAEGEGRGDQVRSISLESGAPAVWVPQRSPFSSVPSLLPSFCFMAIVSSLNVTVVSLAVHPTPLPWEPQEGCTSVSSEGKNLPGRWARP